MIKIFLTVRNRLAMTKKCIYALKAHSTLPHQIYVYNNQTNYLIKEHFEYFCKLYIKNYVSQVTFTTDESNFNAFSKASTCNFFGQQHGMDPQKDKYMFLLFLDNDIIVTPNWDEKLKQAWKNVVKNKLKNIKIIGQLPGGIKEITLPLKQLVGCDKRHDQIYWSLLGQSTGGKPYIMGLKEKLGVHCGKLAGSVCNKLSRNRGKANKSELIKFEQAEEKISNMTFEEFYKLIFNDKILIKDW